MLELEVKRVDAVHLKNIEVQGEKTRAISRLARLFLKDIIDKQSHTALSSELDKIRFIEELRQFETKLSHLEAKAEKVASSSYQQEQQLPCLPMKFLSLIQQLLV